MRRRLSHASIYLLLVAASLAIPLMIQAIFPGGDAAPAFDVPPETPLDGARTRPDEAGLVADNVAWVRGEGGSVLGAGDGIADETVAARAALDGEADGPPLDLRPGIFAGYVRSWDNLEIRREIYAAGGFVYLGDRTRVLASGSRLRFRDDAGKFYGSAVRLEGAHRLDGGWLLEEGLERDDYDDRHGSWNGDVRLSGPIGDRLGVTAEAGRSDVWERLGTIRDRLRLWQAGLSLFYELLPRWWLAALANAGWYSDHNKRLIAGGEAGTVLAERIGLSFAAGLEATRFSDQTAGYWSPSSYHYAYGRLRLSRGYERFPFEPRAAAPAGWRDRVGYLAEVTAGVNDDGHLDVSERAGLRYRATDRLTLRGEFFHLDSDGRFEESFAENRLEAGVEVRF